MTKEDRLWKIVIGKSGANRMTNTDELLEKVKKQYPDAAIQSPNVISLGTNHGELKHCRKCDNSWNLLKDKKCRKCGHKI